MLTIKLPLADSGHVLLGMPQICHNFTKIGVGHQGHPDPYSSASVNSDEGRRVPQGTLALLAGPISLMVMQTTEVNNNKDGSQK